MKVYGQTNTITNLKVEILAYTEKSTFTQTMH